MPLKSTIEGNDRQFPELSKGLQVRIRPTTLADCRIPCQRLPGLFESRRFTGEMRAWIGSKRLIYLPSLRGTHCVGAHH